MVMYWFMFAVFPPLNYFQPSYVFVILFVKSHFEVYPSFGWKINTVKCNEFIFENIRPKYTQMMFSSKWKYPKENCNNWNMVLNLKRLDIQLKVVIRNTLFQKLITVYVQLQEAWDIKKMVYVEVSTDGTSLQ